MGSRKRGWFLLLVVLGCSAILGGLYGSSLRATTGSGDLSGQIKQFTRVLSIVEHNYATTVDVEQAIYDGAIPGMLHVLDPHSNFFNPKQYALFREEQEGRYFGVGMQVSQRENNTVVISPFVGSPAYRAGIRPGDVILKVDGKNCVGLNTTEVASLLKGPKGTVVHITLGREGWDKAIEVTITRDEIPRPGVDYATLIRPGIGYVRVSVFNETTDTDLSNALRQLNYPHLDGLIIDLRGNPGGLLNEAVGMCDMFLGKDQLVVSHRGRASPERPYIATHGNGGADVPLVVLINGQSASASEIVSGAIQDHDRGLIVGETSFGKGLVQTQYPTSENTALLLTTARYYTPSGRLIQRNYKNVSLYDYHYNRQPPAKPELRYTDSGRKVYGGDGITPDVTAAMPKLDDFEQLLMRRGVFFPLQQGVGDFTRYYLGSRPTVTKDFVVDDAVMRDFRAYLAKQHIAYTEPELAHDLGWLKWHIKREVFTSVFGLNAGYQVELREDPQVQKGVEEIPQARALYQNALKILAEHQPSANPSQ